MINTCGFLRDEGQALEFTYDLLTSHTTEEMMNLLKNDKLFPNIRGVMLKDKPVTLHQKTAAALRAEGKKNSKATSQPEQEPDTVDDIPFNLDFDIPEQAELLTAGNPGAYSD